MRPPNPELPGEEVESRTPPPSVRKGLTPAKVDLRLGAPDLTETLREDQELLKELKLRRVGIHRTLPAAVTIRSGAASHGTWIDLGDESRAWILTLESEEAWAIRYHLENLALPPGARLWVYATENPSQFVGPLSAGSLQLEGDPWTPSIFASRVTLELELPSWATPESVDLRIPEVMHTYVPFDQLAWEIAKEDTCYNDVTCDAVYAALHDGVALIHTVTSLGTLQCTGSLLNDYDSATYEDYFLTANHCLSGTNGDLGQQSAASTMEFYWFFRTPTCDGTPPALSSVPRTTGGADLLHNVTASNGNDAAFLRIRNQAPAAVLFMGWTTASPPVGEDTAGIHYPSGTFARVSYGDISGSNSSYWLNVWTSGSTEVGSSGSPLLDSSHRVIGQLQGGDASCTNMSAADHYGRFDLTYPHIRLWMEIGGTIHVDGSYSGIEEGTPSKPFDTVTEGHDFAWDGALIQIEGGSYSETLTLSKQVTLIGVNGSVTIGD